MVDRERALLVREEGLDAEITALLKPFSLRAEWADEMLKRVKDEKTQSAQSAARVIAEKRGEIEKINLRLQKLLDSFLDGIIDRETYVAEKAKGMSQKKTLEEQSTALSAGRANWLEPFQNWILTARNAGKIAVEGSPQEKKVLAQQVFGSNLVLDCKKARGSCVKPWLYLLDNSSSRMVERAMGIEPTCEAWKASVLPLNYARLRPAGRDFGAAGPLGLQQKQHSVLACVVNSARVTSPRMAALLLTNGRVVDPASRLDAKTDVLISAGKIAAVGAGAAKQAPRDAERMDVSGFIVCPGLIDLHVHLRDPGQTAKENIATGTAAAARGGFTSVVCMPNTSPAIDNAGTVALIHERAAQHGVVNVFVTGAITKNIAGEELAPIGSLKRAGVVAITDDGHCVQNNELMRRALEYAKMFDLPVMDHCQDYSLVTDGVMHEGYWSTVLGLRGWPAAGEEMIVARNILLAELTGARVHCQHLSAAGSVARLREAKKRGVPVSGEACPHHFTLTDAAVAGSEKFWAEDGKQILQTPNLPEWPAYDTNFKMNPPLRSARDREAILEGLADGTIEILCSDHAPHCDYEKEVEFDYAPFGITGLETELALSLMQLYHAKRFSLPDLIAKYTVNPARLLNLNKGTLAVGADADVTIFDPDREWVFERAETASKSANSPFFGWKLKGRAVATIVGGKKVWTEQAEAVAA